MIASSLARTKQAIVMGGGGEHGVLREISWLAAWRGGPLVDLNGPAMTASVCPDLRGQITSVIDTKSGKELLAGGGGESGYCDMFANISSQIWLPVESAQNDLVQPRLGNKDWATVWSEYRNPTVDALTTDLTLSPPYYGFSATNHLRRTVRLAKEGLLVERTYQQAGGGGLSSPTPFTTRWRLLLPEPRVAKVSVRGGGIDKLFDLHYAVPGGIRGVKAGQRLPGLDAMDARFDDVLAVSDAEDIKLPIAASSTGDLTLQLDRGDGMAVVLSTPASGWAAIELQPVVGSHYVSITLVGVPVPMDREAKTPNLPTQALTTKTVPVAQPVPDIGVATTQPVTPKIRITGKTAAVNEADGAELVWIPAGRFLRGSPAGKGAGDERPRKQIELDGYWIYKHPVTVEQYQKFCAAAGRKFEPTWGQAMHAAPAGGDGKYAVQVNWYQYDYYRTAPDKNPPGPVTGSHKVLRGGCSLFDERFSRTAARMIQPPQSRDWTPIGFRCVINAPGPAQ